MSSLAPDPTEGAQAGAWRRGGYGTLHHHKRGQPNVDKQMEGEELARRGEQGESPECTGSEVANR